MDSDSERARIPSAMRFSASAASEGVAAPSNSNSRLSPITTSCSDPNQWTPRPSKLDADMVRALPLLGIDLEKDEIGHREQDLLLSHDERELACENTTGRLSRLDDHRLHR